MTLIVPGFSAHAGDDCIPALRELVRELARRHEVEVLALRYPHRAAVYELDGARVTALGGGEAFAWGRWLLLARAARWLRRAVERGAAELVHALWADEPGYLATRLSRRTGAPAVVALMGGELARLREERYGHQIHRAPRWLVDRSLRRARHLTVGSRWLAERARDRLANGRLAASLRLAPLGVDAVRFRPEGPPGEAPALQEGEPRVLAVGSLTAVKGHADLIAAFARAASLLPRAVLHLVGDGPLRAQLEEQAAALGVGGRVRFHGALPHGALPACYRAADFCALASRWESQSMVAVEAAACGRVTVGSAVGVLPELAPELARVAPGDVEGLARALARAGAGREAWTAWGAEARARALPRFELTTAVDSLESVYAEAIAEARTPR